MNKKLKRAVWERDNYQCQHPGCGSTLLEKTPHHIKFKSQGGKDRLDNLVSLCPNHHREVHEGKQSAYWRKHWENWASAKYGKENGE